MTIGEAMVWLARHRSRRTPSHPVLVDDPPAPSDLPRRLRPRTQPSADLYLGRPVNGTLTSRFGRRFHPILKRWRFHAGVDLAARRGSPVWAAANGRVVFAGWRGGYGNAIVIRHDDGSETLYGHLDAMHVRAGMLVTAGSLIGAVGRTGLATGPHLHFERRRNGSAVDPGIG